MAADRHQTTYATITAVFVTFVVLTNTVGVKLFSLGERALPVSVVWFPLTFLVTDVVSEVFGEARARLLVINGFVMSLVLLAFVMIGIALPPAEVYPLNEQYTEVYSPTWRLLFASMVAYLLAQLVDVRLFHFIRARTQGRYLWLRNNGSTMVSQLVDTITVTFIFVWNNEAVFTGDAADLVALIINIYVVKLIIAALDTPLCYAGVWLLRRWLEQETPGGGHGEVTGAASDVAP